MKNGETKRICWIEEKMKYECEAVGIFTGLKLTRVGEKEGGIIVRVNGRETVITGDTDCIGVHAI